MLCALLSHLLLFFQCFSYASIKTFDQDLEEGSTLMLPSASEVIQTLADSLITQGTLGMKNEAFTTEKVSLYVQNNKLPWIHIDDDWYSYMTFEIILQDTPLRKKRQATFFTKCAVLTKRSCMNMHRDMGYYWLRFGIYIGICVSIGTIFFNVGYGFASIQVRSVNLFLDY